MEDKLKKDYPWLFVKEIYVVEGKGRKRTYKHFTPIITECENFYMVQREPDSSPLILGKGYV